MVEYSGTNKRLRKVVKKHFINNNLLLKNKDYVFTDKSFEMRESSNVVNFSININNDKKKVFFDFFTADMFADDLNTKWEPLKYPVSYLKSNSEIFTKKEWLCLSFELFLNDSNFYYKNYLKSKIWRDFRATILNERGFNCEICKSKKNLHIHHLTYERLGSELSSDVMVLCSVCHKKAHS